MIYLFIIIMIYLFNTTLLGSIKFTFTRVNIEIYNNFVK